MNHLKQFRKVSITTDGWTSPNNHSFVAFTVHWTERDVSGQTDQWVLRGLPIGFEPFDGSHTGRHLATMFMDIVRQFKLENKIISVTTDNAANNLVMMRELESDTKDWW